MKQLTTKNLKRIVDMIDETLEIGRAGDPNDADWDTCTGVLFSENEALILKRLIKKFIKMEDSE